MSWYHTYQSAFSFTEAHTIYSKPVGEMWPLKASATSNGKRGMILVKSTMPNGTSFVSVHYGLPGIDMHVNISGEDNEMIYPAKGAKVRALAEKPPIEHSLEVIFLQ